MPNSKDKNKNDQVVDGFSDTHGKSKSEFPNEPDPGISKNAKKPLSPEEYEKAKKEARSKTSKSKAQTSKHFT